MSPKVRSVLLLCAVFGLGGVAGAAASRAWTFREIRGSFGRGPPEARARMRLEAMRHHLDLTDAQTSEVDGILREAEAERERLIEPCRGGLDALRDRTDAKIRDRLQPEQRARFEEVRKRRGPPPPFEPPP